MIFYGRGRKMANHVNEFYAKFQKDVEKMKSLCPETVSSFMGMFAKVMGQGHLSIKQKELIALAIAVAKSCNPCIRLHVQKCKASGATKEEIIEAASVAVMMAGGPAFTHMPEVIDSIEALEV